MSDVIVTNVRMGTYVISDIGIDVPHGVVVHIPSEKALRSKDLWRGISQRTLFQFHPSAIHKGALMPAQPPEPLPPLPPEPTTYQAPETIVHALTEHNKALTLAVERRDEVLFALVAEQQRQLAEQGKQLAEAVRLLRERPLAGAASTNTTGSVSGLPDVVNGDAPVFIPSTIKPKDVEAHVSVQTEASEGSSVSGAASALRRLRQGGGDSQ
jgi:hypothetical protein